MPRQTTALLVAFAVASAAPAAGAAASSGGLAAAAATACAAKVTIAGKRTCLVAGKSCAHAYETRYRGKGFTCKRDAKGRYRLQRLKQSF